MKFRKNNKGFSLVELIIVIAIMVALIAVMAPQFTKYIQRSRDAALQTAAEDYVSAVKATVSDPDESVKLAAEGTITIKVNSDGKLEIKAKDGVTTDIFAKFNTAAGLTVASDGTVKNMGKTDKSYTITVTSAGVVTLAEA